MLKANAVNGITQEMVDNVAQAYGAAVDRIMGAQDLDELVDGGVSQLVGGRGVRLRWHFGRHQYEWALGVATNYYSARLGLPYWGSVLVMLGPYVAGVFVDRRGKS